MEILYHGWYDAMSVLLCAKVDILLSSLKTIFYIIPVANPFLYLWTFLSAVWVSFFLHYFFPPTSIYFSHIEFWMNILISPFSVHKCTSAERMFASRNTDGNETSWSKINKRWSESLADLIEYSDFQLYSNQTTLYLLRFLRVQKVQLITLVQRKPSLTSLTAFVHRWKGFQPGMLQNLTETGRWAAQNTRMKRKQMGRGSGW